MSFASRLTRCPIPYDPTGAEDPRARFASQPPEVVALLAGTAGCSPYLGGLMAREADWLGPFLDAASIARERVIVERESRNTDDNARLSKAVANPRDGEIWVLVTSARHMPRSIGIFRKHGWPMIPYPVDYLTTRDVGWSVGFNVAGGLAARDAAAYEWLGLAYYWLTGRIGEWFPRP